MVSSLLKAGFKRAVRKTDPAAALRISKSNFKNQRLLGPHALREQMVRNPEQVASGAEEALLKHNTPIWTDAETGDIKQIRNYGSKVMNTQGMPLQVNDAVNRVNTRGNQPGQNRADNILATTEGKQDFGTYRGDKDFPKTKSEVAKILNVPLEAVEQHHYNGAAHWGWLFKGTTKDQAFEMHRILEEAGIVLGNKRFNRIDIPTAVHNVLHRTLEAQGLLPKKGDFSKIPFDQRKAYLQEMITDQRFVNEITYDIMNQYQSGVPIEKIQYKPKKAEPNWTGVAKKAIDGQIGKSGWDEARWRSANTQFTWSQADNRGYIDIIKDATGDDAVRTLKAQFFKEIDKLPSGTTWTLEADTAQKYRIYKRMFRDDPRFTPGGDTKLLESRGIDHFVLTIP